LQEPELQADDDAVHASQRGEAGKEAVPQRAEAQREAGEEAVPQKAEVQRAEHGEEAVPQRAEAQRGEAGEEAVPAGSSSLAADKISRKRSQTKTNGGGLKRIKC